MKNRKEKILNKIFKEDKKNLSLLNIIYKHQIMTVLNTYQNYTNNFINVNDEDLNNLYNIINKDLLEYYE